MTRPHRTHEEATLEMFRKDSDLAADYLYDVLQDGNESDLKLAIRTLNKAFGENKDGIQQIDQNAQRLFHILSDQGNPELKKITSLLQEIGMKLTIKPLHHTHA